MDDIVGKDKGFNKSGPKYPLCRYARHNEIINFHFPVSLTSFLSLLRFNFISLFLSPFYNI